MLSLPLAVVLHRPKYSAVGAVILTRRLFVAVETGGEWSCGQTVVDHLGVTGREPNVEVVLEANRERFLAMLHEAVAD